MDRVLLARYANPHLDRMPSDSGTLLTMLGVHGDDQADSLHKGRKLLDKLVSVRVDNQTSIVTLSAASKYPTLAADVANRFIFFLNEFNAKTRQSQARERRSFAQQQVGEAERELRGAEDQMKTFYERNRSWQQAPQLMFEEGRLRRQVEIRQELYLTLKREYETARIEEVNDVPVITVIDSAALPKEASKPRRGLLIVIAFILGGMVSVFGAFAADYIARTRVEHEGEYREFRTLVARVGDNIRVALGRRTRQSRS
jgi:uncharacterized protein involved in exopolysaccharide biosynthesis